VGVPPNGIPQVIVHARHPGGRDDPEQKRQIAIDAPHGLDLGGRGLDALPGLREHRGEPGDIVDGPGIEPKRGKYPLLGQRRIAARRSGGPGARARAAPGTGGAGNDILECAPVSIRASKRAALMGLGHPLDIALRLKYTEVERMRRSQDTVEGPPGFAAEKRSPNWTGR